MGKRKEDHRWYSASKELIDVNLHQASSYVLAGLWTDIDLVGRQYGCTTTKRFPEIHVRNSQEPKQTPRPYLHTEESITRQSATPTQQSQDPSQGAPEIIYLEAGTAESLRGKAKRRERVEASA